jgi:hypothetical protein
VTNNTATFIADTTSSMASATVDLIADFNSLISSALISFNKDGTIFLIKSGFNKVSWTNRYEKFRNVTNNTATFIADNKKLKADNLKLIHEVSQLNGNIEELEHILNTLDELFSTVCILFLRKYSRQKSKTNGSYYLAFKC